MEINIVTATYNRRSLLSRLYSSLVNQSNKNFTWLVVDDGSVDGTEALIKEYIAENKINIIYMFKENGGKHTALNLAIKNSDSNYIFFVDSDDILPKNSIEILLKKFKKIESRKDCDDIAGICGIKSDLEFKVVGNRLNEEVVCSYLDYRYKYQIVGDKAEVFKTAVLQKYLFPVFEGEKFCPEGLIWNRISKNYKMFFFNEIVYNCEYQNDGLTSNSIALRKKSPNATLLYYYELAQNNINVKYKIRALLNFWRFYYIVGSKNLSKDISLPKGFLSWVCQMFVLVLKLFKVI